MSEPTEYVVLIVGDDDGWWAEKSPEEQAAGYAEYERFDGELERRGHRVTGGAELHSVREARRLAPDGVVSDGPFTEVTEQVGGFYQVTTSDVDDLLDCCRIITALGDTVVVRRVVQPAERPASHQETWS